MGSGGTRLTGGFGDCADQMVSVTWVNYRFPFDP
jgi:hypothetical protein